MNEVYKKAKEARLRLRQWDPETSECPVCDEPFSECDHVLPEAQSQLRHDYEDACERAKEFTRRERAERDAMAAFSMQLHFHDIRDRKPFDDVDSDWKGHVMDHFLVIGVWDPDEPRPDAEICMVSYSDRDDTWRYPDGKPWPFAHRIRYWAEIPRIRHDDMGEEQWGDFMSAPENP